MVDPTQAKGSVEDSVGMILLDDWLLNAIESATIIRVRWFAIHSFHNIPCSVTCVESICFLPGQYSLIGYIL